jgi:hypothetical protein
MFSREKDQRERKRERREKEREKERENSSPLYHIVHTSPQGFVVFLF